jgi:Fic family protein
VEVDTLARSPIGKVVPISGFDPRHQREYQHFAYLPDPLPDEVQLAQITWSVVAAAMQAVARLDQAGALIPEPGLLRGPLLRREAVSTSALEGTHAAFTDVLEADVVADEPKSPELREVRNYITAAEHAISAVAGGRPISIGLLREVHALLVRRTRADGPEAGQVRSTQVVIGPDGCGIADARFVPPPADDRLHAGIQAWEEWLSRDRDMSPVVQAALAHYQFETLHPFHDGNGRIGRLIVLLQLLQTRELREPLLEVSPWLEQRRAEYQDHLLNVSRTGDWDPWVRFFAEAIRAQATRTVSRIEELLGYQTHIREVTMANHVRGVARDIAAGLIGHPFLTPTWAADNYNVTYPAANSAIRRLVDLGLLREITGRDYGRVFASDEVIGILNR